MPATVTMPVFVRVGADGEECRAGEMTLDAGEDVCAAYAAFLRALADAEGG